MGRESSFYEVFILDQDENNLLLLPCSMIILQYFKISTDFADCLCKLVLDNCAPTPPLTQ